MDLGVFGLKFRQPEGVYRFGTDAVILSDFAARRLKRDSVFIDLCCGSGLIPLLITARGVKKCIGIEIDPLAADAAKNNAELNGINIEIICGDIRNTDLEKGKADLITVNPPYFSHRSLKSTGEARSKARSDEFCDFGTAAAAASGLLKYGGLFFACYRPDRLCDAFCAMRDNGLEPKRLRFVSHDKDKDPFIFLVEGKKGANCGLTLEKPLFLDGDEAQEIYHGRYRGIMEKY